MQFTLSTVVAFAALMSSASAHLIMSVPPQWAVPGESQAPLDPSGSDFPCQNGTPDQEPSATYTPGTSAPLAVIGSAVHGGGSGQMVLTYDFPPTPNSVWRVMQSFQGDHPVKAAGNFPADPTLVLPSLTWNVPENLPAGKAVLAWTWFNRVGNREMYMKCATVQIDGAEAAVSDKNQAPGMLALPTMFRANSGNGCEVPEGVDAIAFKNPGPNLRTNGGYTPQAIGCDNTEAGTASSGGDAPSTSPVEGGDDESAGDETVPAPANPDLLEPPTVIKKPVKDEPVKQRPVKEEPVKEEPVKEQPAAGGVCQEGQITCNSDNTWSMCGSGYLQNIGPVPAGMQCKDGQFSALKKRSVRFSKEHLRRRHH